MLPAKQAQLRAYRQDARLDATQALSLKRVEAQREYNELKAQQRRMNENGLKLLVVANKLSIGALLNNHIF